MQYSLPSVLDDAAFVLSVIDHNGKPHNLHNSSACGTWVGQHSDGSIMVTASFNGCFVKEQDGEHIMTMSLEEVLSDGKPQYHKKDLKCPLLPAMDAPSFDECAAIPRADRIPCANTSVSRELCESVGCCYAYYDPGSLCFYGNKLTAQCTDDNNMVVVVSKDLTLPSLILDSVSLIGVDSTSCPSLSISKTNSFVGFRFPLACNVVNQAPDGMIYESTLVATKVIQTWQGYSITRDSSVRITVRCTYGKTDIVPLEIEVLTLPPPSPVSTQGPLFLEMRLATDGAYSSFFAEEDYPIVRVLREPVFVEVRILNRNDPSLVLVLDNCWATNSANPTDDPQWPILFNGCPFPGDNYLTERLAVGAPSENLAFPSHYQRFMVSTFTFVSPNAQVALGGLVFFHCSASVCVPSATDSCIVNCPQRKRRMADTVPRQSLTVTSDGPLIFSGDKDFDADRDLAEVETDDLASSPYMLWLIGTAVVGCVLAVILVGSSLYRRWNKVENKTENCPLTSVNA
ncbi:zona pellucida sperm-binding protein 4-like [Pyxicephalus adspersus]|uniref:zona pellucida sperm-binding protein 4-like n=1 Tax=Pyxicephalus adspersus TaxID=30357 RepID=UPI003B5AFD33